jgi:hypothetical protein
MVRLSGGAAMRASVRMYGVVAAAVGAVGLAPVTASAQELAGRSELPTVGCSWSLVGVGIKQFCINVYGDGLYVDRASGELEAVSRLPIPIENPEINLFGTLENGAPYDATEVAPDGVSSASAWFSPRARFQDGSDLCIRTRLATGDFSDPACVTIRA